MTATILRVEPFKNWFFKKFAVTNWLVLQYVAMVLLVAKRKDGSACNTKQAERSFTLPLYVFDFLLKS